MIKFLYIALAVFGLSACSDPTPPLPPPPVGCVVPVKPRPVEYPNDLHLDPGTHLPPRVSLPFQ